MRSAAPLLVAVLLPLACADDARPPSPDATVDCGAPAQPAVTLGFGLTEVAPLARDAEATQIFGPQGGSHVWVGAQPVGLTPPFTLLFEAHDAYSGARLAVARLGAVDPRARADDAGAGCDVHGVPLIFNERFPGGAGLADVTVTATDARGRSATDAQRVWLGRRLPACVPAAGVAPRLVPLVLLSATVRREEAVALFDEGVLRPGAGGEALLGGGVEGFAASAVTLVARLYAATADGRTLLREVRAERLLGDAHAVPTLRRAAPECVAPVTLRLPLDASTAGRPLVLVLAADDGLGHTATVERAVTAVP